MMLFSNPGYEPRDVAIVYVDAINADQRGQCLSEIKRMPNVEACSSTYNIPLGGYGVSGNMISIPGDDKNLINISEMEGVDDNYFNMMQIPIVDGTFFTERNDSCRQVMVSERVAEKLSKIGHWKDGAIGKHICSTGHFDFSGRLEDLTICGVFRDFRKGSLANNDDDTKNFPMICFY